MISQLQMRIAAETIKSQEAHKQNSMLQECIEKLTVELEDNNAKMDDIETQSRDQIGDFLLKLESQSMEIQDLKGMKATLEESNTILEADLLMTKDQIEDLQTHLQQANEQAAAMQESLEHSHRNEASMLRSQLSELTARLHSGQQLIASLKDELATLRLGEGQLRLQIGSLKDQLEERDRQSKEDREEIARLSKALYT
jgi:chromosome segregation ATPase